jgi:glycosyltransferase involved in cell wall biosynthesis
LDFSRQSADGSRLRFGLYNPLSDYTAVPAHIPAKLEIRSESDVGVARRVIDGVGPAAFATPSLEPLKAWKEECIRGRLERRTELFASIGRIPRRRPGRIRVTFVSVASAFSGAEEALCQLAAGIDTERFELSAMVGLDGLFAKKLRSRGVHVFCAGSDFSATNLDSFLYCNAALRSLATDVAHVNAAAGAPFLIAAAVNGVKLVYHLRQAELHQGHEEYVLASEATIAVSNFVKEEALRLDVPPGKITVIYDGVDTEHFNPCHKQKGQACQQLGLDPDRTIVVMIARFAPNKRHELLLEAISLIREKTGPVTIVFVGEVFSDPRHHECVRAKAAACGLSDVVTYLGFQEDIRTVHAAADILVLCSEREPLGQCVLEAMAMGVPVVITDSGGLSELVRDGHTGFVIPAGESASLAECISYLIAQPDRRAAVGEAARDYVMRDVTTRATAATVMELYESVVGSRETCEAIADSAAPSVRLSRCQ